MFGLRENHKKTVGLAFNLLTTISGAFSVVSLIQRTFHVGVGAVAASYIAYYRKFAYGIFGMLPELLQVRIPLTLIDYWALSFICAGAYVRTKHLEQARAFQHLNLSSPSIMLRTAIFVIWGFTGLGFFIPLAAVSLSTYTENDITKDALGQLILIAATTVVFFGINALAPSA